MRFRVICLAIGVILSTALVPASAHHVITAKFDPAKTVVAYCASGGRSALVGKTLKDMGYADVRNLGGFKGWVDAGGQVEKA